MAAGRDVFFLPVERHGATRLVVGEHHAILIGKNRTAFVEVFNTEGYFVVFVDLDFLPFLACELQAGNFNCEAVGCKVVCELSAGYARNRDCCSMNCSISVIIIYLHSVNCNVDGIFR